MTNLETLEKLIKVSGLQVNAQHTDNGEYTIYSEFGIPLIRLLHAGEYDYSVAVLCYNSSDDVFEIAEIIYTGFFENASKEALKKVVGDRVTYFLEWQDASNQIHEIDDWSNKDADY